MNKTVIIVLGLCLLGCERPQPVIYRVTATGERVVFDRIDNSALGTVRVSYLDNDNITYIKVVKKEDIILESEYLKSK